MLNEFITKPSFYCKILLRGDVMKKKIIRGIVIIVILSFIIWMDLPYLIKTSNIISNQKMDYTYKNILIIDESLIDDYDDFENLEYMKSIVDEMKIKSIIDKVDNLQLRRTKLRGNRDKYISFTASYSPKERVTYTEDVFSIYFEISDKGDNILVFTPARHRTKYYKILDKDFDLDVFFKELRGKEI